LSLSLKSWLLGCCLIVGFAFIHPKWEKSQTEATISWDVSGYYMYLPAIFIYQDIKELAFLPEIIEQYTPSYKPDQAFQHESGHFVMKYSAGMAVQYLPFFAIAHAVATWSAYPADGFSLPYQIAIHWGSFLIAFLGLWWTRLLLLRYFSDRATALSLLLLVFGTNYLNYTSFDGAMTHNWLFTLYTGLLLLVDNLYRRPSYGQALATGSVLGLMVITRPSELVALVIPILWAWKGLPNRLEYWKDHLGKLGTALLGGCLAVGIQLIYWRYVSGDWIVYSYQDQGFDWWEPHVYEVLFTFKKGWLVYTPIMLLALIGIGMLFRRARGLFPSVLTYFLINFWIVSAWSIWWYGGSFGQRALVQSYAVMAIPLTAFLSWMLEHRIRWMLWAGPIGFAIVLNLFQTWQSHQWPGLHPEQMTRAYYWRIFLNPNVTMEDMFLLDTKEDYRGERKDIEPLASWSMDVPWQGDSLRWVDSMGYQSPGCTFVSTEERSSFFDFPYPGTGTERGKWFRASAFFYIDKREPNDWRMSQLHVTFKKEGAPIKDRYIRLQRLLPRKEWTEMHIDISTPEDPWDTIRVFLYNPSQKYPIYMDDLTLETYRE
jgi:hypothetical protein